MMSNLKLFIVAAQNRNRRRQGKFVMDELDLEMFRRSDRIISVKRMKPHPIVIPVTKNSDLRKRDV